MTKINTKKMLVFGNLTQKSYCFKVTGVNFKNNCVGKDWNGLCLVFTAEFQHKISVMELTGLF